MLPPSPSASFSRGGFFWACQSIPFIDHTWNLYCQASLGADGLFNAAS